MTKALFGTTPDGEQVYSYTLENKNGMSIKVIEYGATLVSIKVPHGHGGKEEVNLGFDTLEEYISHTASFGATIGRYANRIKNATFELDGVVYHPTQNRPPNSLHGGTKGFGKVVWKSEQTSHNSVIFIYLSHDGDQGYPGNLHVSASYKLTDENEIKIVYNAETDKTTPISLTNHAYFNLTGAGHDVYDHQIQIFGDTYVEVDKDLIPTGKINDVKNTIFDLNETVNLGTALKKDSDFFGYDVCYKVSSVPNNPLKLVAKVFEPKVKRGLDVYTTQPGVQLYTANFLTKLPIAEGRSTDRHGGFCLETQNFADGPNHKNFPNPWLKPGEKYHQETVYKFYL